MLELRTSIETQTGVRISPKTPEDPRRPPKTTVTHNAARSLANHLSEALAGETPAQG